MSLNVHETGHVINEDILSMAEARQQRVRFLSIEGLMANMNRFGLPRVSFEVRAQATKQMRFLIDCIYTVNLPTHYSAQEVLKSVWPSIRERIPVKLEKDEQKIFDYLDAIVSKPEFAQEIWMDEMVVLQGQKKVTVSLRSLLNEPNEKTA